jgi:hypothetical protein
MMKTNKPDCIIAIDPDVTKSGLAELSVRNRILNMTCLSFPDLMEYLQARKREYDVSHEKDVEGQGREDNAGGTRILYRDNRT